MPFIEPGLILPPIGLGRVAFGAGASAGVDDQLVVEVAPDGFQVEHADFDMAAHHPDSVRKLRADDFKAHGCEAGPFPTATPPRPPNRTIRKNLLLMPESCGSGNCPQA